MSNTFCVNKCGKAVPVYSNTSKSKQIGTINNRESFGFNSRWGGDYVFNNIVFLNSSGVLTSGFLVNPPNNTMMDCTSYPYGSVTINGTTYKTFIMRSARNVYTVGATKWGTVSANRRVACLTALSGDSNPHWKGVNYVESTTGSWIKVTGDGASYGFVDTGLGSGSGYSSIPMYGSW